MTALDFIMGTALVSSWSWLLYRFYQIVRPRRRRFHSLIQADYERRKQEERQHKDWTL